MLDEEKIRLMTKISIYEKQHESDDLVLSHYYREDYVRYGCLRTLVVSTITYWSVVAMYVFYRYQELMLEINKMDYFSVIMKLMIGYMGFSLILYIFGFVVYHIRFQLAKKGLINYNRNLKRYLRWEEKQERKREIRRGTVKISRNIGGDGYPDFEEEERAKKVALDSAFVVETEQVAEAGAETAADAVAEAGAETAADTVAEAGAETATDTGIREIVSLAVTSDGPDLESGEQSMWKKKSEKAKENKVETAAFGQETEVLTSGSSDEEMYRDTEVLTPEPAAPDAKPEDLFIDQTDNTYENAMDIPLAEADKTAGAEERGQ